jgi:hypothetical protein
LDSVNGLDRLIENRGHQLVPVFGVITRDVARFPAAAAQELVQLLVFYASQHAHHILDTLTTGDDDGHFDIG